jgi:16S rRNA (guanine527-N7)-methyltransferase
VEALAHDPGQRGRWPAVTARAVASTAELVELAFPLLAVGGRLIAWKRGDLTGELPAARTALAALGGGIVEVVEVAAPGLAGHRLVVITRAGHVPDLYPRDPATRKRHPW